jgi:adenosylmethionine-8-amino-7-oxononanoate aminotransferase
MAGIDLGEHHPSVRLGHQVVFEARRRGAIVRPLGDVIVLMPPLSITKADLRRLVQIVGESIRAAFAGVYGDVSSIDALAEPETQELEIPRAA